MVEEQQQFTEQNQQSYHSNSQSLFYIHQNHVSIEVEQHESKGSDKIKESVP